MVAEKQILESLISRETKDEQQLVSRRQFLNGAMAGGLAGLAVAAGTGVAVWQISDAEAKAVRAGAEAEIARLQGLVDLYEDLEKVGLDAILQGGLAAAALPLEAVELGASTLKRGLDSIEEALRSVEAALPTAQQSILWLEARVTALATTIDRLQAAVGKALDRAMNNPVSQTLKELTSMLLDNLPFGLGDRIRDVFDVMLDLVTGVDELVEEINPILLEPLREKWFSADDGQGLGAILIEPLVQQLLDPLEAHLAGLATLTDTWQRKMVAPAQQALETRAELREKIASYRRHHGFG
jgi:hypothetical protein